MQREYVPTLAERLGWLAYTTVMGGGMPDLATLQRQLAEAEKDGETLSLDPFKDTVPYELGRGHRSEEATAS